MATKLTDAEESTVTVLLGAGNTIKAICEAADLDIDAVTKLARTLDIDPKDPTQRRAKELFASPDGHTYAEVAATLADEGLTNDGEPVHYLTVATWVAGNGWAWGGADDGDYAPDRSASSPARSKYTLRMSQAMSAEANSQDQLDAAADAAWAALDGEDTTIVAVAVVMGAAAVRATDIAGVKKALMERHGDAIRTAKA